MKETKCSDCGSRDLKLDDARGERVCGDCGIVLEENIMDMGAEWRVFSDSKGTNQVRGGERLTNMLHDKGLSTAIGWEDRDFSGKGITMNRAQLHRIRKWQKRVRISNAKERNLAVALAELGRLCSQMGLPTQLAEASSDIYRKANDANLCRGRSIDAVVAASVYVACRLENLPRTLDEVAAQSRTGRKEIGRTSRMLQKRLKIRMTVPRPMDYNSRFCSDLGLSADAESYAWELQQRLIDGEYDVGRGPVGLCASTIYVASRLVGTPRTQRECADVAGVTEVTVRHRYKEVLKALSLEAEWEDAISK